MSAYGEMARMLADAMIAQLGGGLVLAIAGASEDGTASELGYASSVPQSVELGAVHGHVLSAESHPHLSLAQASAAPTTSSPLVTWWELLIPADQWEEAAAGLQMSAEQMAARCLEMTYAGVQLTMQKIEAVCAGGETYVYKVLATEAA